MLHITNENELLAKFLLFKVNNENIRPICKIYSILTLL